MSFERTKELSAQIFQLLKELYSRQDISNLEKDLLKEKLRQLYDIINAWPEVEPPTSTENQHQTPVTSHFENKPQEPKTVLPKEPPSPKQERPTVETSSLFAFENASENIVETKVNEQEEEPEESVNPEIENRQTQPTKAEDTGDVIADYKESSDQLLEDTAASDEPTKTTFDNIDNQSDSNGQELDDEAVQELFELEEVKELSDKLSQSPIADLTKALGINDRLLTVNELFSGDFSNFDESFRRLNQMSSFEEAKSYLMEEVVVQHDWISPDKKARAKRFIKFVRRRYLN